MKKEHINSLKSKIKIAGFILISTLATMSCQRTEVEPNPLQEGQATVSVNVQSAIFEDNINIGTKGASTSLNKAVAHENTISLSKDFDLVAKLIPQSNNSNASNPATKAGKENSAVATNVQYKIAVYNQTGQYITEHNFVHGREQSTDPIKLNGGATYTFIAYSINSSTTVPELIFADQANKTLATSRVAFPGNADFMVYRKDLAITAGDQNHLDILFKHKMSQITTIIDASQTGYNVTDITSSLATHQSNAEISLTDFGITRSGTKGNVDVAFKSPNASLVTSAPSIINAEANENTSYTIKSIKIGEITMSNITAFNDLKVTPGVKYNMLIEILPTDRYLDHDGQKAVRIGDQIWMTHNVGADTSISAESNPYVQQLHGNYYQWGTKVVMANKNSNSPINFFTSHNPSRTSWNLNNATTSLKPEKNIANDPCPDGYRVPTNNEFAMLVENTTAGSRIGSGAEGTFNTAKVRLSKRNKNIKIIFPAQGRFPIVNSSAPFTYYDLVERGLEARLWTSSYGEGNWEVSHFRIDLNNQTQINNYKGSRYGPVQSGNIRCIAEHLIIYDKPTVNLEWDTDSDQKNGLKW